MASRQNSPSTSTPPAQSESTDDYYPPEWTVKKLRLLEALTMSKGATVFDACKRMAARSLDVVLLTDASGLLSGILTHKHIATRVVAEKLRPNKTVISDIMTRNPVFVSSDSLAKDALQKLVQGKFRHLPVAENGEVIALLDITKCLYDAISEMEKGDEDSLAFAAHFEYISRMRDITNGPSPYKEELLRDRMFKSPLSTVISENGTIAIVVGSDSVYVAAKKMHQFHVSYVIIMSGNNMQGILTSKDILLRVVVENLSPKSTLVEKVMTPNPKYATFDTTILEALHVMHDGKCLHLPIVGKDGSVVACVDVLQITQAAISLADADVMQDIWDQALLLDSPDYHGHGSETSTSGDGNSFAFKFEDLRGRVHQFNYGTENLGELLSAITLRMGGGLQLMYDNDEGDRVMLATDSDLVSAVSHARSADKKENCAYLLVLRLHVDCPDFGQPKRESQLVTIGILASVAVVACIVYLKRSKFKPMKLLSFAS